MTGPGGSDSLSDWLQHHDAWYNSPPTLSPFQEGFEHDQHSFDVNHADGTEDFPSLRATPETILPYPNVILEGYPLGVDAIGEMVGDSVLHGHPIGRLYRDQSNSDNKLTPVSPAPAAASAAERKSVAPVRQRRTRMPRSEDFEERKRAAKARGRGAPSMPRPPPEEEVTWYKDKKPEELNVIYTTVENIIGSTRGKSMYGMRARMRQILTDEEAEKLIWGSDNQKRKIASKFRVNGVRAPEWFRMLPVPTRMNLYKVHQYIFGTNQEACRKYFYALNSLGEAYQSLMSDSANGELESEKEQAVQMYLMEMMSKLKTMTKATFNQN